MNIFFCGKTTSVYLWLSLNVNHWGMIEALPAIRKQQNANEGSNVLDLHVTFTTTTIITIAKWSLKA